MKKKIVIVVCIFALIVSVIVYMCISKPSHEDIDPTKEPHYSEVKQFTVIADWGDLDQGIAGVLQTAIINELINKGEQAGTIQVINWNLDEDAFYNVIIVINNKTFIFRKAPVGQPNSLEEIVQ